MCWSGYSKPKVLAIIQARKTSTRLPNKILQTIGDKTILQMTVEAVEKAKLVDEIVIAAPHEVPSYGHELFISIRKENDVLGRYYDCAKKYGARVIVRITSDCPLLNPIVIDWAIQTREDWAMPYCYFAPIDGWDVEVFTSHMLTEVYICATSKEDREHVTPFMKRKTKISVDSQEDLEKARDIWSGKIRQFCL